MPLLSLTSAAGVGRIDRSKWLESAFWYYLLKFPLLRRIRPTFTHTEVFLKTTVDRGCPGLARLLLRQNPGDSLVSCTCASERLDLNYRNKPLLDIDLKGN